MHCGLPRMRDVGDVMKRIKDMSGAVFGRLTVLRFIDYSKNGHARWLCLCSCGNKKIVDGSELRRGSVSSCGCWNKDCHTTHGDSAGPNLALYKCWKHIKQRCYNKKDHDYNYYGGRGISVCEAWKNDYSAFKKWAIKAGWFVGCGLTIERIDNDSDYEPSNCRWATRSEQSKNRRSNRKYWFEGKLQTITDIAKELGISVSALSYRIKKHGLNVAFLRKHHAT